MHVDELIGQTLGDYRIVERIGRGGMARVYRAYQASVNRDVAIKVIATDNVEAVDLEIYKERFEREARVVASLEHSHVLPIYDYGLTDSMTYIVMRLLSGGSLSDQLSSGPLSPHRAADIFRQVARGLDHAHSKGIIHRDLKPANIMFDSAGDAYLTDFGLAKWVEDSPALTQTGKIVGTPAYMSPEQLRGDPLDRRSDIYSMGIILYQMLTGVLPFDSTSGDVITIIYQHLEKPPPSPRGINPDLPPEVEAVVLRALAKEPEKRYDTIIEVANSLDLALGRTLPDSEISESVRAYIHNARRSADNRKPGWLIPLALVGSLALLLGLGSIIMNLSQPGRPATAVILVGEEGSAADIVPTHDEVLTAQQALGPNGFVAYVTCNQTSEYHATQAREMGDFAGQYELDYRVYDSDTDDYAQLTQIERARTDGAKALIICPLNPDLLQESLAAVDAANIPLVLLSQDLPSFGGVQVLGDEYLMGYKPGELAGQIIRDEMGGEARVVVLDYPDLPHIVRRADGLEAGVLAMAPEATIVGRYLGATPDFAAASVRQLIADGVEFDVIVSINDAGSFGAIRALEEAGIGPDEVFITSVDAEQLARRYILDGYYIRGSVDVGREKFSHEAIDSITKLLAGGTLPERILVPPGDVITAEMLAG
jgi:serine/threonine protein kinase/DNA-binding LacI/PurR family transcriptional regulator